MTRFSAYLPFLFFVIALAQRARHNQLADLSAWDGIALFSIGAAAIGLALKDAFPPPKSHRIRTSIALGITAFFIFGFGMFIYNLSYPREAKFEKGIVLEKDRFDIATGKILAEGTSIKGALIRLVSLKRDNKENVTGIVQPYLPWGDGSFEFKDITSYSYFVLFVLDKQKKSLNIQDNLGERNPPSFVNLRDGEYVMEVELLAASGIKGAARFAIHWKDGTYEYHSLP